MERSSQHDLFDHDRSGQSSAEGSAKCAGVEFLANGTLPPGDFLLACCLSTYHADGKVVIIHTLPAVI